tara:strand:- start:1811 stop:2074 length:264 start_codon:yes stop_codon:yes gene_type:complete
MTTEEQRAELRLLFLGFADVNNIADPYWECIQALDNGDPIHEVDELYREAASKSSTARERALSLQHHDARLLIRELADAEDPEPSGH